MSIVWEGDMNRTQTWHMDLCPISNTIRIVYLSKAVNKSKGKLMQSANVRDVKKPHGLKQNNAKCWLLLLSATETITVVCIHADRNDTRLDAVCGLFELPMITWWLQTSQYLIWYQIYSDQDWWPWTLCRHDLYAPTSTLQAYILCLVIWIATQIAGYGSSSKSSLQFTFLRIK